MVKKIIYCTLWSIGLFVSTFYSIICKEQSFAFDGKMLVDVASSHIFPMIMAMTLYLLDVMYSLSIKKSYNDSLIQWILGTIIIFMGCFVTSLLVNNNIWGWFFFCIAWLSLTVLKFQTTDNKESVPYIITED